MFQDLFEVNTHYIFKIHVHQHVSLKKTEVARRVVHSSHQFVGEVTNQVTNFKSPILLFQVTKMCCKIQLQLRI